MANTFELASDPVRLAYLAETEGRAGLSRLADYFSNAGEPMPPALQRAVAFSRNVGPSDAAATGAGFSYENPYALADLAKRAGPAALFEEAKALEKAGRPLPAAVAQALMANRSALFSGKKDAATAPFTPAFDFAANLEPETRPVALTPPAATDATEERTPKQTVGSAGVEAAAEKVPPWAFSPSGRSIPSLYGPPPPSIFASAQGARPASVARPAVSSPTSSTTVQGPAPSYTLEEIPSSSFAPPSYTLEEAPKDPTKTGIPTASAPPTRDSTTPVVSTRPPVTPASPAGKPESTGAPGLPAPSSEGAGGDALSRLGLGQALVRALEGSGSVIAGRDLRSGAAETLGERMKQIEALRAKREERAEVLAQERTQNDQLLDAYKGMFPEQAAELENLRGATGKPMFRDLLAAWQKKTEFEKAKLPTAEARVAQMGAGTAFTQARTAEVGPEGESRRLKREQDIALGWARLNAQMAQAAARASRDVAAAGASRAEQRDVDGQLENIQKIVKGGSYTSLIASLEQADKAIADLGAPPSAAAQVKHALPGGDRFLSPQEKAYYTSVDKLRQMDQLAVSGRVVSEPERAEFLRQYGANWYASPKAAAAYIDMLRAKTASQLNSDLASVRASPSGQKALAAYERQPGAITPMHPVFKGAGQVTGAGADKVRMKEPGPAGRTARIPAAEVEARKAQGWTEVP